METEHFSDVSEIARSLVLETQKFHMVYFILLKAIKFKPDFKACNCQQQMQKMWANFKVFFREAKKELQCIEELTIEETMNHTEISNLVDQGICQAFEQQHLTTFKTVAPTTCFPKMECASIWTKTTIR
eukprot:12064898-Ditylum_brightwellii.AAC.1